MNKRIIPFYIRMTIIPAILFNCITAFSQDTLLNKYGLWVINSVDVYKKTVAKDPQKIMVALSVEMPEAIIDLKYAGIDNFMHTKLYPAVTTTYLRLAASDALFSVMAELRTKHMTIKIWDAYRPYSVTEKMWEPVKDNRYAADPKFGSGHNRGIAVDLTIVDLITNKELDMGTGFDNFSDTAHHAFTRLPKAVLKNRKMLRSIMQKYGFEAQSTEWWHYSIHKLKYFEILDISFSELDKNN